MTPYPSTRRRFFRTMAGLSALTVLLTAAPVFANAAETSAPVPSESVSLVSKNTQFVTRDGASLKLGNKQFRFAGTNAYWLGLDENVGGVNYPTFFRIRDALDTAKAMGMTVVRSHMLASTGNPLSLLPSKEAGFNEAAFATVDYAIAYAGSIGIRLVLPLTDQWEYYHGGHRDFTDTYGLPAEAFYTDERVIADYQAYVSHVMRRVNPLTGKRYNADPTIMAWELGNELEGMTLDWITANVTAFRAQAPRQLIAAGRRFDIDPDTLAVPGVDIVDVHYYPPTAAKVQADAATVAAAGKVYIAGEYASNAASDELFAPLVAAANVTGMLSWSLFGHNDRYGFVQHDDGFTFHYPGDNARMTASNDAQIAYARALNPAGASRSAVGQPLITAIAKRGGLNVLQWRGAAAAVGYQVQRQRAGQSRWSAVGSGLVTDNETPLTDLVSPGDVRYRVVPVDRNDRTGSPSEPVYVGASDVALVDPLETFDVADAHAGVKRVPGKDVALVRPSGTDPAWVSWANDNTQWASFDVVTARRTAPHLAVQVSADGSTWSTVRARIERQGGGPGSQNRYTVTAGLTAADHVRLAWTGSTADQSATSLVRASFRAADPAPVATAPGAVNLLTPEPGATAVVGPRAFTWSAATGAGFYTVTVSRNVDLSDPVLSVSGLSATRYPPTVTLDPATTYTWQVTATNAGGTTSSAKQTFTTRALPTIPTTIDDFEAYADSAALAAAYPRNSGGDVITPTLVASPGSGAGQALQLDTVAGTAGYAGVSRTFSTPIDMWGQEGISLWLDRSGTTASTTIQFVANGVYWEYTLPAGGAPGVVRIPFSSFKQPSWAPTGPLDLQSFSQLSIYVGGDVAGRVILDDVVAYPAG